MTIDKSIIENTLNKATTAVLDSITCMFASKIFDFLCALDFRSRNSIHRSRFVRAGTILLHAASFLFPFALDAKQ